MKRSTDVVAFAKLLAHPEVAPHVWLDRLTPQRLCELINDEKNYLLCSKNAALFFHWQEPGVYELHTQALPEGRGKEVKNLALEAIDFMFCSTDCMELLTKVELTNHRAALGAHIIGFTAEFEIPRTPPMHGYALRFEQWVAKAASLLPLGEKFHSDLSRGVATLNKTLPPHPPDLTHDRRVGACAMMLQGGQIAKAVILYNRWARFTGYDVVKVISVSPLILDVGQGVWVSVEGDKMEVLRCP